MNYSTEQLAYLAGLIDGEGCMQIGDKRKSPQKAKGLRKPRKEYVGQINFTTQVQISNTDYRLIHWLQDTFTGGLHVQKYPGKPHWNVKYTWILPSKQVLPIMQAILPYLIIKKNQALLMIEARKIIDSNVLRMERTPEQRELLFFLAHNMRLFNKKDPSALLPSYLSSEGF